MLVLKLKSLLCEEFLIYGNNVTNSMISQCPKWTCPERTLATSAGNETKKGFQGKTIKHGQGKRMKTKREKEKSKY